MHGRETTYAALGRRLKELRDGKPQLSVAKRVGFSVSQVCRAEKGHGLISIESRARQLHRDLSREHGKVAEVARLGEAVAVLRPGSPDRYGDA